MQPSTNSASIRQATKDKYVGMRYGLMTITEVTRRDPKNTHHHFVRCRCDCGAEKEVRLSGLQQGSTTSCGCAGRANRLAANLGHTRNRKGFGENAKNSLFARYKQQAESRGIRFDLTRDEFLALTGRPCYYCGCVPRHVIAPQNGHGSHTYNGVDRVDNDVGYTSSNCVPACRPCNAAKNAITRQMVVKIYEFLFPSHSARSAARRFVNPA